MLIEKPPAYSGSTLRDMIRAQQCQLDSRCRKTHKPREFTWTLYHFDIFPKFTQEFKCQGEKKSKERKQKLPLLEPGIYNQIKDEAWCNYVSHLGENSIIWQWKLGWDFLAKIIYMIFRGTDPGYLLEKRNHKKKHLWTIIFQWLF